MSYAQSFPGAPIGTVRDVEFSTKSAARRRAATNYTGKGQWACNSLILDFHHLAHSHLLADYADLQDMFLISLLERMLSRLPMASR